MKPINPLQAIYRLLILLSLIIATGKPSQAGLVARWSFDEASGSIAHDRTGTYNGMLSASGAAFVPGGVSGNAMSLNKTANGFVNFGNVLPFTTGDFTIVAWIKMQAGDTTDDRVIIAKHEAFTQNGYILDVNTSGGTGQPNKAFFYDGGAFGSGIAQAIYSTSIVNDGAWHQVVGVHVAGGNKFIYVDGAPAEASNASRIVANNAAPLLLGGMNRSGVATGMFTGLIDEVQIYNQALSASEVDFLFHSPTNVAVDCSQTVALLQTQLNAAKASNAVLQAQLTNVLNLADGGAAARWSFDEIDGTMVHDSVGSYNGTLSAAGASFVPGGISGNALRLNSVSNGFVNFGNVLPFTQGNFSVVAWVKMQAGDMTQDRLIIAKHAGYTQNGYFLNINSTGHAPLNKALFYDGGFFGSGVDQAVSSTTSVNDGAWHQIVGVHVAGGNKFIYVDGAPAEASNASQPVMANTAPLLVGGVSLDGILTGTFTGLIDEVQIYNRSLTPEEVDDLFHHPTHVQLSYPQQVALLESQLASANAANVQLQSQLNAANASNAVLQVTIGRLTTNNLALQSQLGTANATIADLRSQIRGANSTISSLQAKLAAATAANANLQLQLNAANAVKARLQVQLAQIFLSIDSLTELFQNEFDKPNFRIPGATLELQVSNIVSAIQLLKHGEQHKIFLILENRKKPGPRF